MSDEEAKDGHDDHAPTGVGETATGPVYVNHCAVDLSLSTAELQFGQASEEDQSVRIKSRLVTSPAYFRQLGDIIRAECRRYDNAYGTSGKKGDA
ncbi:DUF3467 domain-containing protein [Parerythrobacter jejuensis]|uniref:DUF3467 domain-containing protein n=1 Tax=Parerythrobacter jejuensis TaxID=795812 RepID=A0A845AZW2_9SPHN|nr:DUF3467 domain-containing protein [Parerythrobacter jejuensis]MXP31276.1 hypothetical protein [Parerythrobacter jejuensis]MXP34036.1 hypothetical protein [Parerythrobacter jejuensis]